MAGSGKKAFLMRIDPELWKELERLAATDLRSVNGQVEYLLRDALNKRKGQGSETKVPKGVVEIKKGAGGDA